MDFNGTGNIPLPNGQLTYGSKGQRTKHLEIGIDEGMNKGNQ